ncbi:MAG TPA: CHASE domain-containing protein, partial [bacterium]|nr:CHASE domain-containing protein [bacterium]
MALLIRSKRLKWALALLVPVVLLGTVYAWNCVRDADRQMREDHLRSARLIAQAFNVQVLLSLSGTEADLSLSEYLRLKNYLAASRTLVRGCRFVYLMGRKPDGKIFFYADSEPVGSADESPAGQIYEEASEELIATFSTQTEAVEGPVADRWGTWVSAQVPIQDPKTGRLVAVLGVDIAADDWQWMVARASSVPIVLSLILAGFVVGGQMLLSWRDRLGAEHSPWLGHIEAWLAAMIGLVLTFAVVWQAHETDKRNRAEVFAQLASTKTAHVLESLKRLRDVEVEGLAQFFEGSEDVTPQEFHAYARHLTKNPAIQAWLWVEAVPRENKEAFEQRSKQRGLSDYEIWESDSDGKKIRVLDRETYYPVLYVAPTEQNDRGLGYDLGSDPT